MRICQGFARQIGLVGAPAPDGHPIPGRSSHHAVTPPKLSAEAVHVGRAGTQEPVAKVRRFARSTESAVECPRNGGILASREPNSPCWGRFGVLSSHRHGWLDFCNRLSGLA